MTPSYWTVEGYTPYVWLFERLYGVGFGATARCLDVPPVAARVPGSVQGALRAAGILPDWNIGTNWRAAEWVEHRHWMYRTHLPDEFFQHPAQNFHSARYRLECLGLDYSGWVYVNGQEAGTFIGTHVPHHFDVTPYLQETDNILEIVFDLPPRWLGQFGYTSQMREWKTRFNYTWDWAPRLVQIGIWDTISLVAVDDTEALSRGEITDLWCVTDANIASGTGKLKISGRNSNSARNYYSAVTSPAGQADQPGSIQVSLEQAGRLIRTGNFSVEEFAQGIGWEELPVKLWWPNLEGEQPLYLLRVQLLDNQGKVQDVLTKRVGFKHIEWQPCAGAPPAADPWICVVNGRPVFLQGVNFAPLCANFADLRREDYESRLKQYQELGLNTFRINACQFLEREWFYDLCDELGLLVWQELPLTSSGIDNWPPEDQASINSLAEIARSFMERRRHHVSLLLWSGGNELQGDLAGNKYGMGKPCDLSHPMLKRLQEVAQEYDPHHRFIATSPSGPRAGASPAEFGQGLHWDVHGGAAMSPLAEAQAYWAADDALFRSEIYCPGASSLELILKYAGDFSIAPPTAENPYWGRLTTWWIDWQRLVAAYGREPGSLEEYIEWSQAHQARMIAAEMKECKERFPGCGGVLLWSGHDTFPLTINSTLIDFDGQYKPSALAVAEVWHRRPAQAQPDPRKP